MSLSLQRITSQNIMYRLTAQNFQKVVHTTNNQTMKDHCPKQPFILHNTTTNVQSHKKSKKSANIPFQQASTFVPSPLPPSATVQKRGGKKWWLHNFNVSMMLTFSYAIAHMKTFNYVTPKKAKHTFMQRRMKLMNELKVYHMYSTGTRS